ncbi:MAG: hypothetical protein IK005_06270 [Paludibacteraceae bacterium]|nr:hypothetical protein [Paludibacteraceae bacterium]MBR4840065.1 hypothetical protein [Paludibacteraceae bacterium]
MNKMMRYVGITLVLLGVILLALYFFNALSGNGTLGTAAVFLVIGLLSHIILNKFFQDDSAEGIKENEQ